MGADEGSFLCFNSGYESLAKVHIIYNREYIYAKVNENKKNIYKTKFKTNFMQIENINWVEMSPFRVLSDEDLLCEPWVVVGNCVGPNRTLYSVFAIVRKRMKIELEKLFNDL